MKRIRIFATETADEYFSRECPYEWCKAWI